MYEGALGMGLLSLKGFRGGGLGGGELLLWGPWKICSDSLRVWVSLFLGAPVVPRRTCVWGEDRIPGTLKDV
jgi:hypothetical protein